MKVSIVKIGNSRGIRIPKALLEECHLDDEADLEVERGDLVIRSPHKARQGWENVFQKEIAKKGKSKQEKWPETT